MLHGLVLKTCFVSAANRADQVKNLNTESEVTIKYMYEIKCLFCSDMYFIIINRHGVARAVFLFKVVHFFYFLNY